MGEVRDVPLVSVTYKPSARAAALEKLRAQLPDIVSRAVTCDEEPYIGALNPGDIVLTFAPALATDDALDFVIEIRTSWYASRAANLQERADAVRIAVAALGIRNVGVWIELPSAAWSQD